MAATSPRQLLDLLYEDNRRQSQKSLWAYLDRVLIEMVPQPRLFREVKEWWQLDRDRVIVPAMEFIGGWNGDYGGPTNFWLGYSKGHDKSSYIGRILSGLLAFAPRKGLRAYCCAKDSDQAAVIYDAMIKESELNPWVKSRLDFKRNKVEGIGNGSVLQILTADEGGVHGLNPDVIIADELTNWPSESMWGALNSSKVKRSTRERSYCVSVVLTNAGYLGSWQDRLRLEARASHGNDWYFFEQQAGEVLASWMRPETIAATRRTLTESEAKRLFDNIWLDPAVDCGAFRPDDVDKCIGTPTPPPPGATVVLAVDYGEVRDRTALCSLWWDGNKLHVVELDCWQGTPELPVPIADVEKWLLDRLKLYPSAVCVFDKSQMVGTMQRLERQGYNVKGFNYNGGKQNQLLAENLRNLLINRQIVFSRYAGFLNGESLADELKQLVVKEMVYGWRLDHKRNDHDDRTISLGMGALEAIQSATDPTVHQLRTSPELATKSLRPVGGGFKNREHFNRRGLYGTNSWGLSS